jgi:hypothetical protein
MFQGTKNDEEEKREWMHQTTLWKEGQMFVANCSARREGKTVSRGFAMHKKTGLKRFIYQ